MLWLIIPLVIIGIAFALVKIQMEPVGRNILIAVEVILFILWIIVILQAIGVWGTHLDRITY